MSTVLPLPPDSSYPLLTCSHCLKHGPNLLSYCLGCTNVLHCSRECAQKAIETYHKYECKAGLLGTASCAKAEDVASQKIIAKLLLSLRILFSRPIQKSLETLKKEGFNNTDQMGQFCQLDGCWGKLRMDREPLCKERVEQQVIQSYAKELAKAVGFVDETVKDSDLDSLLSHIVRVVSQHGHFISKFLLENGYVEAERSVPEAEPFAFGLFPSLYKFKHSCIPNAVATIVDGGKMAVVATGVIEQKEEVRLCLYDNMAANELTYSQRKSSLSEQFGQECACPACLSGIGGPGDLERRLPPEYAAVLSAFRISVDSALAGGGCRDFGKIFDRYEADCERLGRREGHRAPVEGTICDGMQLLSAAAAAPVARVTAAMLSMLFQRSEGDGKDSKAPENSLCTWADM